MNSQSKDRSVIILMPVFNDWESAFEVIRRIVEIGDRHDFDPRFLCVDDGSTDAYQQEHFPPGDANVEILQLRRNVGHQRAICIGITWIAEKWQPDHPVVIMDSDGEDQPEDITRLLEQYDKHNRSSIVFAERTRRSEGLLFSIFYALYRWMHLLLVGQRVRVGNFSVVSPQQLQDLTCVPELWNHYAAAVIASRQRFTTVPTHRGRRIAGKPKMNFVGLVIHGLSALSVFSDRIGVRISLFVVGLLLLVVAGLAAVVSVRVLTDLAIPGWATYAGGLLVLSAIQLVTVLFVFCFVILVNRNNNSFIPCRDFEYFVRGSHPLKCGRIDD